MTTQDFLTDTMGSVELNDAPINPSWILEGQPRARSRTIAQSGDGGSSSAEWECTAGAFRWYFAVDETVHIVEGKVTVTGANGVSRTLRAGDVAFFPQGTWMVWEVDVYVRKLAFLRQQVPGWLMPLVRVRNRLTNFVRFRLPAPRAPVRVVAAE
ncbi:MAG: cupin domain-containing protein [Beijerinckiaceae bacterium]